VCSIIVKASIVCNRAGLIARVFRIDVPELDAEQMRMLTEKLMKINNNHDVASLEDTKRDDLEALKMNNN
jgi:hypothetical protein